MDRIYNSLIKAHLDSDDEMVFISGPRQVGKTTVCRKAYAPGDAALYLNWDNEDHRQSILSGPSELMASLGTHTIRDQKPILVLDEIHKRPDWKNFLKGLYDSYGQQAHIIVCGSASLAVYQKGGDSLMGRYFPYRMHPLSVGECGGVRALKKTEIEKPFGLDDDLFEALYQFGGFPKPFFKCSDSFSLRWQNMRMQQLVREDVRDLNVIHDIRKLEILVDTLRHHAAQQLSVSYLARICRVSHDTITRWLDVLEGFYYCYRIRPWHTNIPRALTKEPKVFLWDWSQVEDPGAKAENFVASHLWKAVQWWSDRGLGTYSLYYIRTKEQEEVDFLVTKNDRPWFLVEVKRAHQKMISRSLIKFQKQTHATHAFQVVVDMPYVDQDCFQQQRPVIVPARTFLSQLV